MVFREADAWISLMNNVDIAAQILNAVMDVHTFYVLCLVNNHIQNVANHPCAWASLDVHIEGYARMPTSTRKRMLQLWRYVNIIHACERNLEILREARCWTSYAWKFNDDNHVITPNMPTMNRLIISASSIPRGVPVCFAMRFAGHMPSFTVGVANSQNKHELLKSLCDESPLSQTRRRHIRARVADLDAALRRDDRVWINGHAAGRAHTIRLADHLTGRYLKMTTLRVTVCWDMDRLCIGFNNNRLDYMCHFAPDILRRNEHPLYLAILISRQRGYQSLTIRERRLRRRPQ